MDSGRYPLDQFVTSDMRQLLAAAFPRSSSQSKDSSRAAVTESTASAPSAAPKYATPADFRAALGDEWLSTFREYASHEPR